MLMMMETSGMDAHQVDIDSDFEPHARSRSCTWPLPPCPEGFLGAEEASRGGLALATVKAERYDVPACRADRKGGAPVEIKHPAGAPSPVVAAPACMSGTALDVAGQLRKAKSSRRNAWGNLSYADLITRAIESAPEKRLTLSQIYDWMVRFVPYFKDKGDSNSSAGWKNSIRHNLSLHSRFIRVQNEGTGKSSWWMLNPEGGKMGKGPRRRASSIDNGTRYLKTKGRTSRKRAGAIGLGRGQVQGAGPTMQRSPEHGSPAGKGGVMISGEEYDTWTDLHSRTSSSASTLSGCLSPILAEEEADEPEEGGLSCSASPRIYPSPTSTRSPALGTGSHCPNVELPQLTDLTGAISLDERSYSQQQQIKCNGYPFVPGPKPEGSYCGPIYGQSSMCMLRHHTPMETIQENKPVNFQHPIRGYSENNALQSLLTGGPYCNKDAVLGQGRETHALLTQGTSVHSQHNRNQNPSHNQNHSNSQEHARNPSLRNGHGSVHDQNTAHHQNHNQGHKHQASLDYSHSHKPHIAHEYGQSHEHGHRSKVNSNHDHNPHSSQSHLHNHTPPNPHNPMHSGPHHQALSPRVSTDVLQPYSLKNSNHYGPRPHLPTSPSLPPNPAGILDVPQDPCSLASAPHPRHQSYPRAHHQAMAESWQAYYHNNHNQQPGNSAYQGQLHSSHNRMAAQLEMENAPNSLDCDVDPILLSDFMDTDNVDFNFDGSLSQGVGMGMGMTLGAFSCPPPAHSHQSWVPG
ncbi:forkhead box protein O6b [Poeciliopsis prolifica]|uniref:forkhead box protein O6b n=1 Tax=Poeciliopsis prolifica TaxID=188132 RepID=UPI0024144518|nr:forkhead box protein O6b [Poeciliopsis prolifica]